MPTPRPASGPSGDRPFLAILLINFAILAFTVMDGIIKSVSDYFPTGQILFCRNLFAFVPILAFAFLFERGIVLKTARPWGHVWRGLFGVMAMFGYFLSYKLLPLSAAIALGLSGPIFLTAFSVPLLGEQVGWRRWSAVIVGFIGVIVMMRPGIGVFDPAALVPLVAAVFYALAMISIRRLTASEKPMTIVFYFTLFATAMGALTLPFGFLDPSQAWQDPRDLADAAILVTIGLIGGCGQILITIAFKRAAVSLIAPFEYMALVYGFAIGFFWFGEDLDRYLMLGGAIVVASGLYIIHRETLRARQRRAAARNAPPLPPGAE